MRELTLVRGIGEWTAHMFLMFQVGRLDVWPIGDLGVRAGFGRLYGIDPPPTPKVLEGLGEPFRPYRSLVACGAGAWPTPSCRTDTLRSAAFNALLVARSLSWVGDGIANVALVIYVQRVEGSGSAVGLLLLMTMLPSCLAPFTGVVVDRFDRRRVLVAGRSGPSVLALVIVIWLPGLAPLLVLIFLKSVAATVGDIAGRSAIPSVVDDDGLVAANAWFGGARQAADVIGPGARRRSRRGRIGANRARSRRRDVRARDPAAAPTARAASRSARR